MCLNSFNAHLADSRQILKLITQTFLAFIRSVKPLIARMSRARGFVECSLKTCYTGLMFAVCTNFLADETKAQLSLLGM